MLGLDYYNKISQFFIRKGNKAMMEKLFKNLLLIQALDNNKKVSILQSLENCFYNSMYFIKLIEKSKKRKKHIKLHILKKKNMKKKV
jgi:hypothetical protein